MVSNKQDIIPQNKIYESLSIKFFFYMFVDYRPKNYTTDFDNNLIDCS